MTEPVDTTPRGPGLPPRSAPSSSGPGWGTIFVLMAITCGNCNDIQRLKGDVSSVESAQRADRDVDDAAGDVADLKRQVSALKGDVWDLKTRTAKIERECAHP